MLAASLAPLALGHDQEASACPWAHLTRRTAEYPSRRAQLAIAVTQGLVPPTPDVVERLYRCDDCAQCRAYSILPNPPDLARALWPVREWLVDQGAVPEVDSLRINLAQHDHIYGDLSEAWATLGSDDDATAKTLFVPDGAVLAFDPLAAAAALWSARACNGSVALLPEVPDSGQVLLELGLAAEAGPMRAAVRQRIEAGGFQRVLAGTPKEAVALAELLEGMPVRVEYAGSALARAFGEGQMNLLSQPAGGRRIAFHPSAALLHTLPDYALIETWLTAWLGDAYCREPDAQQQAWPAAVERPAIGLSPALARTLAQARLDKLTALGANVILTTDPFSRQALRSVAPAGIEVHDLLTFAAHHQPANH